MERPLWYQFPLQSRGFKLSVSCSGVGVHDVFPFCIRFRGKYVKNPMFIVSILFIILFNIEILFSKAYHFYRTEQNIKQVLNPVKFAQPLPFTLKPMLSTWIPYANTNRRLASLLTTGTLGFGLRSDFVTTTFYCTSHFLRSDLICSTK